MATVLSIATACTLTSKHSKNKQEIKSRSADRQIASAPQANEIRIYQTHEELPEAVTPPPRKKLVPTEWCLYNRKWYGNGYGLKTEPGIFICAKYGWSLITHKTLENLPEEHKLNPPLIEGAIVPVCYRDETLYHPGVELSDGSTCYPDGNWNYY